MTVALVTIGGALLIVGGVEFKTRQISVANPVPQWDRIAGVLIGLSLIATGLALAVDAPTVSVTGSLGIGAVVGVVYSFALWRTTPGRKP